MSKQYKTEEIQSRREFFKKTAKLLPVIAGIALGMSALVSCHKDDDDDDDSNRCKGSNCTGGCTTGCYATCSQTSSGYK